MSKHKRLVEAVRKQFEKYEQQEQEPVDNTKQGGLPGKRKSASITRRKKKIPRR